MSPTVGRIVHCWPTLGEGLPAGPLAAIVTAVREPEAPGSAAQPVEVDLTVFVPGTLPAARSAIRSETSGMGTRGKLWRHLRLDKRPRPAIEEAIDARTEVVGGIIGAVDPGA